MLRNGQRAHQTQYEEDVADAVAALDFATQVRETTMQVYSTTAANAVSSSYKTAWLAAETALEAADKTLQDKRNELSAEFNRKFVAANLKYHTQAPTGGTSANDDANPRNTNSRTWQEADATDVRTQSYYQAILTYMTAAAKGSADVVGMKKLLKQGYLQADKALEETLLGVAQASHGREAQRNSLRSSEIAEAQRLMIVAQAGADATYAATMATAGKAFQLKVADEHSQARQDVAQTAFDYATAFGQDVKAWNDSVLAAAKVRDVANADGFKAWRQTDIAAWTNYRTSRIDAERTYAEDVAEALFDYKTEDGASRKAWDASVNQAGKIADLAAAQADRDVATSYGASDSAYSQAVLAAGQVFDLSLRIPTEAWRIQVIQAETVWNDAIVHATADLAQAMEGAAAALQGSDTSVAEQAIAAERAASALAFLQTNVPQSQWNDATLAEVAQANAALAFQSRVEASTVAQSAYQTNIVGGAQAWLTQANVWSQVAQVEANATDKGRQLAQLTPQLIFETALQTAFDNCDSTNMSDDLAWSSAVLDAQKDARITTAALDLAFADEFAALDQSYSDASADAEWTQDQTDLLSQRVLTLADALRASLTESIAATADWTQATDGAGADTAQALATATAESDWLECVWTDWKARQDNHAALDVPEEGEPSATEAILEAWRQLVTELANADKAYATSLNTTIYRLEDQAYDRANADEDAAKTKEVVRFLQRISDLQTKIGQIASVTSPTDPLIALVTLENPSGVPPQPGRPPRTGDLTKDLLNDLAYFERIGLPVRNGNVAVYEDDKGNMRNGLAAFGVALGTIKDGFDAFATVASIVGSFGVPLAGAYGFLHRLPETINAIAEGDPTAVRSALTGLLLRLPGAGMISTIFRIQNVVASAERYNQTSAEYDQSGDKALAGLRLMSAAADFYHSATGAVHGAFSVGRALPSAFRSVRNWLNKRSTTPPKMFDAPKPARKPPTEKEQTAQGVPQRGRALEEQWRGLAKEDKPKVNPERTDRNSKPKSPLPADTKAQPFTRIANPLECKVKSAGECFEAGTPMLTPDGDKFIEQFEEGDRILSRNESSPDAPLEVQVVERVFSTFANIAELRVGGKVIRTTLGHRFRERTQGWISVGSLKQGDELATREGVWIRVESVMQTDEWTKVYNVQVSGDHTYFVGSRDWAFSIWAHNDCTGAGVNEALKESGLKVTTKKKAQELAVLVNQVAKGERQRDELVSVIRKIQGQSPFAEKAADGMLIRAKSGTIAPNTYPSSTEFTASTGRTYKVFQRSDIDWDQVRTAGSKDFIGKTNAEAARKGFRPQLADGSFATLHHSQQSSIGPRFEASTRYHNISNAKKPPLHPWRGGQHSHFPLGRGPGSLREAFQEIESPEYWTWREANR